MLKQYDIDYLKNLSMVTLNNVERMSSGIQDDIARLAIVDLQHSVKSLSKLVTHLLELAEQNDKINI
jgi:hypothetical protein